LELNPSFTYARTYYGQYLAARGRFDEALRQTSLAQRLDPQSAEALRLHAVTLYYKRDYQAAEETIRRAFDQEPDSAAAHLILGRIAEATGRVDEALALTERASELSGDGGVPLRVGLIRLQAVAGRTAEARTGLADLEKASAARTIRLSARDRAYIRLAFGQSDAALEAFEQALEERDTSLIWLGVDPRVDSLRDRARFVAILRKIGLS
jgi:tetratricopeptide (TPR) repeat protein